MAAVYASFTRSKEYRDFSPTSDIRDNAIARQPQPGHVDDDEHGWFEVKRTLYKQHPTNHERVAFRGV